MRTFKITIYNGSDAFVGDFIITAPSEELAIAELLKQTSIVCGDKIIIDEE